MIEYSNIGAYVLGIILTQTITMTKTIYSRSSLQFQKVRRLSWQENMATAGLVPGTGSWGLTPWPASTKQREWTHKQHGCLNSWSLPPGTHFFQSDYTSYIFPINATNWRLKHWNVWGYRGHFFKPLPCLSSWFAFLLLIHTQECPFESMFLALSPWEASFHPIAPGVLL